VTIAAWRAALCRHGAWTEGRLLSGVLAETGDQRVVETYCPAWRPLRCTSGRRRRRRQFQTPRARRRRSDGRCAALVLGAPLALPPSVFLHAWLARLGKDASGYSLIHADMHPGNILVDGERLTVIDFDDAGFGWHQYDIAVVLSYWQSKANAAAIERAFLDGYRTTRQLPDDDLTWIPMFRLIRGWRSAGSTSDPN
jgi:aminoglycoside phosphotransferase (APT) family kinase protein